MPKRLTTEEFVSKAKKIHGDKYDYSKVEYINNSTKVCIICPKHGEFWQVPNSHLQNHGCPSCYNEIQKKPRKYNKESFISFSNKLHNNKYDYSKVEYVNNHTKVCIICPEHGEFWQLPYHHLGGHGCPKCGIDKFINARRSNTEEFVSKAKKVHNNKYDYSNVEYKNSSIKVCIICPKHGEFWQRPSDHVFLKCGCPKCVGKNKTNEEWIQMAKDIHHNIYDYSKVEYVNTNTKVCIICPKHGEFWQYPTSHIDGSGCPKCNSSHMENNIRKLLSLHNIKFAEQKRFIWLGKQSLDFYLPEYNIAIECQGIQHFEPIEHFGSNSKYMYYTKNDQNKKKLCEQNGIKLLYYANYEYDFPYEVITENNALIEKINKCTLIK